jgi:hypothetical protein
MFTIGTAIGSVVTWKLLKTRYEVLLQEEIESVKEAFANLKVDEAEETTDEPVDPVTGETVAEFKATYEDYCELLEKSGYTNGEKGGTELMEGIKPYVIPPEEYGEKEDYEQVTFSYFADGVVAYEYPDPETGEILFDVIQDVDDCIGRDNLLHFGEYEDDSLHVRNDRMEVDYEILRDYRNFEDIVGQKGHVIPGPEEIK